MINLLVNGDFEGPWREVGGVGELKVAHGWVPWWLEGGGVRPEYKIARRAVHDRRVADGVQAQQWFNSYNVHTAGILQQVAEIVPGRELTFSALVQCFSRDDDSDFNESEGRYRMRIGLDPYGGLDAEAMDVVWSNDGHSIQPYDNYEPLSVTATARSDRCTVFVWGQPEWKVKHNNAYVDSAILTMAGEPDDPGDPGEPGGPGLTEAETRAIVRSELARMGRAIAALG